MNKKFLFSMLAVAGMMAVTSCTQDELYTENTGDNQTFTFNIGLEGRAATRAMNDGLKTNLLIMEVYDNNGVRLDGMRQEINDAFKGSLKQEVNITLAKGQTYDVVFWAQTKGCAAYDTTSLDNIQIKYENIKSNEETRDAFYGNAHIEISADGTTGVPNQQEVTLKRPFAQLNFAVSPEEWANTVKAGVTVENVTVAIPSGVNKQFNALSGVAGEPVADKTFAAAPIIYKTDNKAESLVLDLNGDGKTESYYWLAMNYVLVNEKENANAVFTFTTTDRGEIKLTSNNTPLQRNYRTNLIGRLTSDGSFAVVVDPITSGQINDDLGSTEPPVVYSVKRGNKSYQTIAEAVADSENPESIIELGAGTYDMENNGAFKSGAAPIVLKGLTIQAAEGTKAQDVILDGDLVVNNGTLKNLTIDNVNAVLDAKFTANGVIFRKLLSVDATNNQELLITDCTFGATPIAIENNITAAIKGSTFAAANYCVALNGKNNVVSFNDNTVNFTAESGLSYIHVEGENNSLTIGANTADKTCEGYTAAENVTVEATVNIANGVMLKDGNYIISSAEGMFWFNNEVNVNNNTFNGKTVVLANNIDLNNQLWAPVGQTANITGYKNGTQFMGTFDGKGFTIFNLKVDTDASKVDHCAGGLFGWLNHAIVQNVTVENAVIKGHYMSGTIAGYLETAGCSIINCHAINTQVSCTYLRTDLEGDKVGGIVGYAANANTPVSKCTVSGNSTIDGVRDAGKVVGAAIPANITECSAAKTVTVECNFTAPADYSKQNTNIGAGDENGLIGRDTTKG